MANIDRYRELRADILADTQLLEILKAELPSLASVRKKTSEDRVKDRLQKSKRDLAQCLEDLENAGL
ncbi:hypothetical protein [Corallococcus macrosporus]|uniref:Uncharacterized protein n=1 Tax=Myxococcus fulvus (strain ATCC BAA-855 / HW-1) TaxID=483219 RepID=F8C809_MYXFH|nr:hypothetical protein [Corallococcus macrosporus]AEI66961.1 hypothetical protein LILAB_25340 [Corallococcus macrosporus]